MKAEAILRTTEALRDRLQVALSNAGVPGSVFVGPLDDPDAGGATLILFLYRVVANSELRNTERRVQSPDGSTVDVFQSSLPLDLCFLLTVGTTPGSSEETMLRGLGIAMQALQLDPELVGPRLDHETIRVTLEPLTTEEMSRIWALFPNANYRTSVAYLATPVWIDPPQPQAQGVPVVEDELRSGVRPRDTNPAETTQPGEVST